MALLFVLCLIAVPSFAQEPAAGKVMIVMDASGSMWGQIKGEAKIVIARRVIHDLLKDWDQRIALGLAAYGHRRKGDCKDIEVLVPVGKGTQKAILKAVDTIKPMGKTPLTDAVLMAAEALKYTEERATVILVSDGKETCEADPCKLGKELKEKGVDFTAHVIGFDVKKAEEGGLRCLAKNTGGLYAPASDAGSLKKALETTVVEVKKKAAAPIPVKVKNEEGVKLVALYNEGGREFKGQINWYIFEPKADASGKRKQVAHQHRGMSGHVFRNLPPGKYVVVAELSDARYINREFEITVSPGEGAIHKLVLNIGTVRFDARLAQGGEPFKGDLGWFVVSPKADLSGKHQEIAKFWRVKSGGVFLLPAGTWSVNGTFADARYINVSKEISVEPGGEEAHDFVFNAGTVRFDAGFTKDTPPIKDDIGWFVVSPKADLSGKRKEIAKFWRVKSGGIFLLPAGKWLINGTLADARYINISKEISVEPGSEEAHGFIFNAGRVRIEGRLAKGANPFKGNLAWWLLSGKKDLSGKRKEIAKFWRVNSGQVFVLPAGNWLLQGSLPDYRHVNAERPLSLQAGEEKQEEVVFNAGTVKVAVTVNGKPHKGQVGWEIFNAKADKLTGKRPSVTKAWRVNSGRITILHEGDYHLTALVPDDRETKGEVDFSIGPNEEKTVTVDLKK
jgi:Ca-activated chloride channel family protein